MTNAGGRDLFWTFGGAALIVGLLFAFGAHV
jgi:hypothetical protein